MFLSQRGFYLMRHPQGPWYRWISIENQSRSQSPQSDPTFACGRARPLPLRPDPRTRHSRRSCSTKASPQDNAKLTVRPKLKLHNKSCLQHPQTSSNTLGPVQRGPSPHVWLLGYVDAAPQTLASCSMSSCLSPPANR